MGPWAGLIGDALGQIGGVACETWCPDAAIYTPDFH